MTFSSFLTKQNSIYTEMQSYVDAHRDSEIILPAQDLRERKGGIVNLSFDEQPLYEISNRLTALQKDLPIDAYPIEMQHTTITVFKDEVLDSVNEVQEELARRIQNKLKIYPIEINFEKIVFNDNSVILAGQPNQGFFNFSIWLTDQIKRLTDFEVRMPKMAHVTLARFTNEDKLEVPKSVINVLYSLVDDFQPFIARPTKFSIGEFKHSTKKFSFSGKVLDF